MDYTKLQNGSDIRGVAMEGIEGQHVNLTEQACRDIGRGFALWLRARLGKDTLRVAVGRDSRLSGPQLALWLMEAMAAEGLQVTDLGMASTPAMFMSTVTEGFAFDASVMITASHLPFNRNGYKFFTKDGGLEKQDIAAILALAGGSEHTGLPAGSIVTGSFMDTYAAQLRKKVQDAAGCEQPLAGMRIVVDAGNGAGGFYCAKVLEPLGAAHATGVDIDPKAEDIARENAAINQIFADRFTAVTGDVIGDKAMMESLKGHYDVVLANIVADVIIPLSRVVPEFLQEDSIFICSGILNTRLPEVLDALEKNGLQILSTEQQEDWCRVTAALLET